MLSLGGTGGIGASEFNQFTPNQQREKWIKKRTSVKIRYATITIVVVLIIR